MDTAHRGHKNETVSIVRFRQGVSVILACVLVWCGFPRTGHAQGFNVLKDQGTISSVDCQGLRFVVTEPSGPKSFAATPSTQVLVSSTEHLPFCALQQFIGTLAIIWSAEAGNQQVAGRIEVGVLAGNGVVPGGPDTGGHGDPGLGSSTSSTSAGKTGSNSDQGSSGGQGGQGGTGGSGSGGTGGTGAGGQGGQGGTGGSGDPGGTGGNGGTGGQGGQGDQGNGHSDDGHSDSGHGDDGHHDHAHDDGGHGNGHSDGGHSH